MIARTLEHARASGELALVAYVTAGFPSSTEWVAAAQEIVAAGADVLEVGIPFSDPIADGPTIQRSSSRALEGGTSLASVLDTLARTPLVIPVCVMSYLNPLLALGDERTIVDRLGAACVSGLVVPDLPAEEAGPWRRATAERGVDLVGFVAPTSTAARVRRTVETADVLYYVAVTGTTGVRSALAPDVRPALERLRRLTELPIVVGFGIGQPDHVRRLHGLCDGVVVGSRLVEALERGEPVAPLVRDLARAAKEG